MTELLSTHGFLAVIMVQQALLALALYVPLRCGQLSLAIPGFYTLGGYTAAILSTQGFIETSSDGLFPWWGLVLEAVIASVSCAVLAVVIGFPSLRLRGVYFALATVAFVEVLRLVSLNLELTGGAVGLFGIPQVFEQQGGYMWILLPLLLAVIVLVLRLERHRDGVAMLATGSDELAASAMGVNTTFFKMQAFVMSAILAGLVGVISAHALNTWNARQGTFDTSINILAYVLIGGSRHVAGPVVGAFVLTALPEMLRGLEGFRLIVNGFLLVVGAIYMPKGIVHSGLFGKVRSRSGEPRK